jgi:hypothetical protein
MAIFTAVLAGSAIYGLGVAVTVYALWRRDRIRITPPDELAGLHSI